MALDKISYTKNQDGTFQKTVVHVETVSLEQFQIEQDAVNQQLAAFQVGRSSDPQVQADIDATIAAYQKAKTDLAKP